MPEQFLIVGASALGAGLRADFRTTHFRGPRREKLRTCRQR